MMAFSNRENRIKKKVREQKFKFKFVCEFELEPEDFWEDGEPPKREITIEEVLEHIEDQHSDAFDFMTEVAANGVIDGVSGDLDVTEILPPSEEKSDDDDIFSDGAMMEGTSLSDAVGKVIIGETISEMVRS